MLTYCELADSLTENLGEVQTVAPVGQIQGTDTQGNKEKEGNKEKTSVENRLIFTDGITCVFWDLQVNFLVNMYDFHRKAT